MVKQKIKSMFKNILTKAKDHFQLLFKSAAVNHLRIQEMMKNPDGTYQLTVKFGSYSELKNYQKKLRRVTVSLSSAVAMMIVAVIVAPFVMNPSRSSAASFQWIQSGWGGVASSNPATKTGTTGYESKDANITAQASGVSLTLPTASTTGDDADYTGDTTLGFYVDATSKNLTLRKPQGATCGNTTECKTGGTCNGGTCCNDACCGVTETSANGISYGTVLAADGKCWLDRNLGATSYPYVPTAYNDINAYGWLFQWGRPVNNHQIVRPTLSSQTSGPAPTYSYSTYFLTMASGMFNWYSGTNPAPDTLWQGVSGVNNPCPTGFRLPTQPEWSVIMTAAGIVNYNTAFSSSLKLTSAGRRNFSGALAFQGSLGYYWSSSPSTTYAHQLFFDSGSADSTFNSFGRSYGSSVRCIKD